MWISTLRDFASIANYKELWHNQVYFGPQHIKTAKNIVVSIDPYNGQPSRWAMPCILVVTNFIAFDLRRFGGRSVHHRSIQRGRFITWTVHHTVNSTPVDSSQKLLYSAVIVFNISFSKVRDTW